ncbi:hypothetical protein ACLESO_03090 [Pyxidicoccus sp. 3LG]
MKLTSRIALVAAIGTVATSAFAAPAAAAKTLPHCVKVKHTTGIVTQTVDVKNTCPNPVGWYVDKEGPNSHCRHTRPGQLHKEKWRKIDAYHGTYSC